MKTNEQWDKVIENNSRKQVDLSQLWNYKDLIFLFVKRDFIVYYKQTILGPLWYIIQPLLSTVMYMIVFGTLANIGTDSIPQPLFYFSGSMIWTYFSGTIIEVSSVFRINKDIFSKVYFPRLVLPISIMISLAIKFIIQTCFFFVIYIYFVFVGYEFGSYYKLLFFPLTVIWIGFLGCGLGMIVSALTTRYKDLALALNFLISLFMYAAPIVYPISSVPKKWIDIYLLNPVCAPIELYRYFLFNTMSIDGKEIFLGLIMSTLICLLGIYMFVRIEKSFVDVI